jgi:hypothetical protein
MVGQQNVANGFGRNEQRIVIVTDPGALKYIQDEMNTYMHTYMHTYIHTYIHTYVHTYIHTYIHFMCPYR